MHVLGKLQQRAGGDWCASGSKAQLISRAAFANYDARLRFVFSTPGDHLMIAAWFPSFTEKESSK